MNWDFLRFLVVRHKKFLTPWLVALGCFAAFVITIRSWNQEHKIMQLRFLAYQDSVRLHPTIIKVPFPVKVVQVVHDTLPTTTDTLGERRAEFHDSTFAGRIDGTVIAPPTGALGIHYSFTRPAFTPTLILSADSASIEWQGEHHSVPYHPPAPVLVPVPTALPLLGYTAEVQTTLFGGVRMAGGVALRPTRGWSMTAELSNELGGPLHLYFGVRRDW